MNYVLDTHTHSLASGHAYSTIREMAYEGSKKGLQLLGITEHAPAMPGTCHEYYFMNLRILERSLCGIEVMYGAELNIMDYEGNVDMEEYLLAKMDVTIASLHTPCIKPGTAKENTRAYINAMKNPYVNIIGHPDDSRYLVNYEELVLGAKEYGVLLEVNNNSLHPLGARENPIPNDVKMLEYCKKYEVPVILGSDAHVADDVGNHQFIDTLLECMEFPEHLIVNRSVEEFKRYTNRYKKR